MIFKLLGLSSTNYYYTDKVKKAVERIPKQKLIMMDNNMLEISGNIREIYQGFEDDIFTYLSKGYERLKKYKKLFLIYPRKVIYPYPLRILKGFVKFCGFYNIDYEIGVSRYGIEASGCLYCM